MSRRGGGGGGTSTEMNPEPTLCLVMEKGPLQGQELKFPPGAKIQIGRILRGNTLAVKDAGVSTKHLAITFGADAGGWTISDLDSSNGTHLNSVTLEPFSQVRLSDGDIIKIGELTSIKVRIAVDDSKADVGKPPRVPKSAVETESVAENPRPRRGRVSKKEAIVDVEADKKDEVVDAESAVEKPRARRGRVSKKEAIVDLEAEKKDEVVEAESVAEKLRPRRGRVSKKEAIVDVEAEKKDEVADVEAETVAEMLRPRRGRPSKKKEIVDVEAESVAEKLRPRKGRVSKKEENVDVEAEVVEVVETRRSTRARSKEVIPVETTSMRRTWSAKREVTVEEPVARKGARSRKNTSQTANEVEIVEEEMIDAEIEECSEAKEGLEEEKLGLELEESKEVEENNVGNVEEMVAKMGSQSPKNTTQTVNEVENVEDDKLGSKNEERKEVEEDLIIEKENVVDVKDAGGSGTQAATFKELDLEKTTVGGLIDYLEEYLPQQSFAETEETISKLKEKYRRVHQYMLEQKKARGKALACSETYR